MDIDRLREYVRLKRRQKELDAELKALGQEIDQMQETLLETFAQDGVTSMTVDGSTVYLHRQLWAGAAEGITRDQMCEGLRETGLGHFVHEAFNTQTLSSWVRDLEREGEELPPDLEGLMALREVYQLRVRRTE